jgi:hypothetical protein
MPRICTVCSHDARRAVDKALAGGASNRSLASLYDVSEAAMRRHARNHLPARLVLAEQAREVAEADDLLAQVGSLHERTLAILEASESTGKLGTALGAIREARSNVELLARLLGELNDSPTLNVIVSPEWVELRAVIVGALEPYREARGAVLRAIEGAGNGRA